MNNASGVAASDDAACLGQPKGLAFLAFTELWERFSYYGMGSLVVLYMVQELLLPGHIEHVAGMAVARGALENRFGPLSPQALASMLFGLYGGLVYLTPIIGGWLADRWFGAKRMVLTGVILMTFGHAAMIFEESFLLALLLLILGSGALKGNIAAQVGQLYPLDDESRRARGFTIFSAFINIGAFAGPLVCGLLAQIWGWHYGFGFAGILMLFACAVYLAGGKYLPDEGPRAQKQTEQVKLTPRECRTLLLMLPVLIVVIFGHVAYFQSVNVGLVWTSQHVALDTTMGMIPAPWFTSIDPLSGIVFAPLLILWWRAQARRQTEPGDIGKIGIGMVLLAFSMGFFAIGALFAGTGKTSPIWPVMAYMAAGIGFLWYWPITLAFVSQRAPQSINSMVIGTTYLTLFVASLIAGYLGSLYEKLGPVSFFLLNAAVPATGGLLILIFGAALKRAINRPDPVIAPSPKTIGVTA